MTQDARDWEQGINFVRQDTGVSTATQFAAEAGNVDEQSIGFIVNAGGFSSQQSYTNTTGSPVFIEVITASILDPYTNDLQFTHRFQDSQGSDIFVPDGNPPNHPINFDPGLPIPDGGTIALEVSNYASNDKTVIARYYIREL